jgi:hypothetical protein
MDLEGEGILGSSLLGGKEQLKMVLELAAEGVSHSAEL